MAVAPARAPRMTWRPPEDPLREKQVRFVTAKAERRRYEVGFAEDGALLWGGSPLRPEVAAAMRVLCNAVGEPDDGGIFVLTGAGTIYMADQAAEAAGPYWFHHSSFVAAGPVAVAGILRFRIDRERVYLDEISDFSGHYQPGIRHTRQVLVELLARGVDLAGLWVSGFHFNPPVPADLLLAEPTLFEPATCVPEGAGAAALPTGPGRVAPTSS